MSSFVLQGERFAEGYWACFEFSPVPICIYDVDTLEIADVNEAAVSKYGFSRSEFLTKTISDLRPTVDVSVLLDEGQIVSGASLPANIFCRHKKKNGQIFNVRLDSKLIKLGTRKCEVVFITDLTQTDAQLMQPIDMLDTAASIGNLGYWENFIIDGTIKWSKEAYNIFEIDEGEEITLEKVMQLFSANDKILLLREPELEFSGNDIKEYESKITTRQGGEKWIFQRMRLIRVDGKPFKLEGTVADITATKLSHLKEARKAALAASLNRFTTELLLNNDWKKALCLTLEKFGQALELDRIYYFEYFTDDATEEEFLSLKLKWESEHAAEPVNAPDLTRLPVSRIPQVVAALKAGMPYFTQFTDHDEGHLKSSMGSRKIDSLLAYPILVKGKLYGHVGFQGRRYMAGWDEEDRSLFSAIASNIAVAIDRQLAHEEILAQQKQLQSLWDNIPGITYRCRVLNDGPCQLVFLSEEFERATGYASTDFINRRHAFSELLHPDDAEFYEQVKDCVLKEKPFHLEFRLRCADGKWKWFRDNGRGTYDANGQILWVDGVMVDITDNKEKEMQLRNSNERFSMVTKATCEAIVDWDIANDNTLWGEGFQTLFGFDLTIDNQQLWSGNIHPNDKERVLTHLERVLANKKELYFFDEFRFLNASGQVKHVQHRGIFVRDENGVAKRAVGAMIDVTESYNRLQQIEEQNKKLIEIAWMQSHLLRAPIANILGLTQLLITEEGNKVYRERLLREIYISAAHVDGVIRDVVTRTQG